MKKNWWIWLFLGCTCMLWAFAMVPGRYKLDTGKSEVYWKCDKHNGILPFKDGYLQVERDGWIHGHFDFDLQLFEVKDLDSKQYGTAKTILENTLKNEFFEIDKYPDAYYDLYDAYPDSTGKWHFTGDLTFHGITNCVQFTGKLFKDREYYRLESDPFYIDRTDWGVYRLSPSHPYPDDEHGWTVTDSVLIRVDLWLYREK